MKIEPTSAPKRQGGRRGEILGAARAIFIERGYAGTTTDAIVERSGGSKETIYSHFGSKLGLFRAVIVAETDRLFAHSGDLSRGRPEEMLRAVGRSFVRSIDADTLQLARVIVGEREKIQDILAQIQASGADRLAAAIAAALTQHQARGTFGPANALVLARAYVDLLSGQAVLRRLFDPAFEPTPAELDGHVDLCVDIVMRLAAPAPGFPPFGRS